MGEGINEIRLEADIFYCSNLVKTALSLLSNQINEEEGENRKIQDSAMCILEAVEIRLEKMKQDYAVGRSDMKSPF